MYLGNELVSERFVSTERDLRHGECRLQEEPQWQLGQLRFDERSDALVAECEDRLALLIPHLVLFNGKIQKLKIQ